MKKFFSFKKRFGYPLRKKIRYLLDDYISKGFWAQVLLLAGSSILLTLLFGVITLKLGGENYTESYWASLMHMIDQGTITGDEVGTDSYFMFMLFVTIVGMAFTGTIIAIITSAIQDKLNELKKGYSGIIEKDHVVILGFNENALTVCREIVEGCRINGERTCLVVADDLSKDEMEQTGKEFRKGQQIFEKSTFKQRKDKKIRILYRSGDPVSENTLSICAVQNARTIVINRENDSETIRILLALASYLKKNNSYLGDSRMPTIVALIHDRDNLPAAETAAEISFGESGEGKNHCKIQLVQNDIILERLFAQACVQQGLPYVMDGLFNHQGSSIQIESGRSFRKAQERNPFVGKTRLEIAGMVTDSIPLGFVSKDAKKQICVRMNPPETVRYQPGDRLIYLSEKARLQTEGRETIEPVGVPVKQTKKERKSLRNFLLIGWSDLVPGFLKTVSEYCADGSTVILIVKESNPIEESPHSTFRFRNIFLDNPYQWSNVRNVLSENSYWLDPQDSRHLTNIVLLSEDGTDAVSADDNVMVLLLNIRQYLKSKGNTDISVTSEMRLPQNQMLLQKNSSNDFVVATEISNRMIAQITDNPGKRYIIEELLEQEHTLIELHSLSDYIDVSQPFNFAGVFRFAEAAGKETGEMEIPLGWLQVSPETEGTTHQESDRPKLVLNPSRYDLEEYCPGGNYDNYRLIVLTD